MKKVAVRALAVAFSIASFGGLAERNSTEKAQRLSEAYRALLTPMQDRKFLAARSVEGRIRYAESLGLRERYEIQPAAHQAAILTQEIVRGMGRDAVLMAWGEPYERYYLRDGVEEWIYKAERTLHLNAGERWSLFFKGNQLTDFSYDLLDAPETPRRE